MAPANDPAVQDAHSRLAAAAQGIDAHKARMMAAAADGAAVSGACATWASYKQYVDAGIAALNDLAGFGFTGPYPAMAAKLLQAAESVLAEVCPAPAS